MTAGEGTPEAAGPGHCSPTSNKYITCRDNVKLAALCCGILLHQSPLYTLVPVGQNATTFKIAYSGTKGSPRAYTGYVVAQFHLSVYVLSLSLALSAVPSGLQVYSR